MTAAEPLLRWLVDGTLAASAAVLLVLAVRGPLRRAFGARVAYGAWALVRLELAAAALPRPGNGRAMPTGLLALHPGVLVGLSTDAAPVDVGGLPVDWTGLVAVIWLAGAALAAAAVLRQQ